MSQFSDRAWTATARVRQRIEELPFLTELTAGTLATERFRNYLEQDALYLGRYARALALLSATAPDAESAEFWAASAQECGVVETQLHADLLTDGLLGAAVSPPAPAPTCLAYSSYVVATAATESYAVGTAAVLPCFLVYADVGARLAPRARAAADHPYRRWVEAYDAEPFQQGAAQARRLADAAAQRCPADEPAMLEAFAVATRYELEFWRAAYACERWSDLA